MAECSCGQSSRLSRFDGLVMPEAPVEAQPSKMDTRSRLLPPLRPGASALVESVASDSLPNLPHQHLGQAGGVTGSPSAMSAAIVCGSVRTTGSGFRVTATSWSMFSAAAAESGAVAAAEQKLAEQIVTALGSYSCPWGCECRIWAGTIPQPVRPPDPSLRRCTLDIEDLRDKARRLARGRGRLASPAVRTDFGWFARRGGTKTTNLYWSAIAFATLPAGWAIDLKCVCPDPPLLCGQLVSGVRAM
jgi:hypothetical protein